MENDPKCKVLVIDDDEKFLSLAKRVLESWEYTVELAGDSEEATCKIYHFEPRVVVLDVIMPALTGVELVKMIKSWRPEIEVIMVTASPSDAAEKECMQNGAFAYMAKPLNFTDLDRRIKQAVNLRKVQEILALR